MTNSAEPQQSFRDALTVIAIAILGVVAVISVPFIFLYHKEWALLSLACVIVMVFLRLTVTAQSRK